MKHLTPYQGLFKHNARKWNNSIQNNEFMKEAVDHRVFLNKAESIDTRRDLLSI